MVTKLPCCTCRGVNRGEAHLTRGYAQQLHFCLSFPMWSPRLRFVVPLCNSPVIPGPIAPDFAALGLPCACALALLCPRVRARFTGFPRNSLSLSLESGPSFGVA